MTYLPPFNGGRINANITGNTVAVGTLISSGTMVLAGGNNITLSQAGQTITISGPNAAAQGSDGFGMSNIGNTSGTTGMVSGSQFQFALAGGNNVTLSQSLNASSGTITISAANQTVQTQSRFNLTLGGNSTSAGVGYAQISSGTLTLAGGNNITLSQDGNAVTILGGGGGGSVNFSAGTTSNNLSAVTFSNSNGLSFGLNGSTLTASHNGITLQSNQNMSFYAVSDAISTNTIGESSSSTFNASSLPFKASGPLSIGFSSSSFVFSARNQTAQTQNVHNMTLGGNTAGVMAQVSSGTLTLAGGNNVVLSQAGNAVTISASNQTVQTQNLHNLTLGGNTAGVMAQVSSGTLTLAGGNNIVLSQAGNAITISDGGATLSRWEYPEGFFTSLTNISQGQLSINHMYVPFNVTGSAMKIGGSLSASTNTSATTASANMSLWMGIYTLNGSTLSLASSGSANNGFQWSQSASSTGNTSINSMRQMTVPMNVNMTPGQYWVAAVISSATTYTNVGYTIFGNSQINNAATGAVLSPIGSNTTANRDVMLFQGIYTTATSAGPASMSGGHINNTSASNVVIANFYNVIYNATY